jgi:CRP/FNR family transcriptional regulator, cyclic AMP receptor protein
MASKYDELEPVLRKATIFAGLREEGLRTIVDQCDVVKAANGEVIIREGTPATEIFVLLEGRVKITLDQERSPLEICEFGPGSCLGEASVIGISAHSASAVAIEDTTYLVLSRKMLTSVFEADKEFFSYLILNIARELARRLHHTDEILLSYIRNQKK